MIPQETDCKKLQTQSVNLRLDGRDLIVIFNALMVYRQAIPPPSIYICQDCQDTHEHLLMRFDALINTIEQRIKNEGKPKES